MQLKALSTIVLLMGACFVHAAPPNRDIEFKGGKLIYNADERGNRVPDYSYAGYRAGEVPIPTVPAKVVLGASDADNTAAIQAAIDQVGQMPANADGFRGAVLIPPGEYPVKGSLVLNVNGVVLRGSGAGEGGTVLRATGHDRRTLIKIRGAAPFVEGNARSVADPYVPLNANRFTLNDATGLSVGDVISISHPSTKEWITFLGMDDFGGDRHGPSWRPGSRDIHWLRTITKIEGNAVLLDVPLMLALDSTQGTSTVDKVDASKLLRNAGVENLRIVSDWDPANAKDEDHAWFGVGVEHARDVWVRRVTCENLAGSAVAVWESSSRVTVEECKSLHPVGEIGGWRRNSFYTSGQQVLMQRLYSEGGLHDFAVGLAAAGPNAFVECEAVGSFGESGAIDSAACGTLFDRVRVTDAPISLRNRDYLGYGAGWASFNGMLWNTIAPVNIIQRPPGAQNWARGAHGEFSGDGSWADSDDSVEPDSLYYAQLAERVGEKARDRALLVLPDVQGSRAPTLEGAAKAIDRSMSPRVTLSAWIDELAGKHPIETTAKGLPRALPPPAALGQPVAKPTTLDIVNGWITIDGKIASGGQMGVPWWRGSLREEDASKAGVALTRFVPGREGLGLTDDLEVVANQLVSSGMASVWQHPPLWYERRRDDHSRVKRMDGEVVAPFYDTPWARSGQGTASDGLSKWDLTKVNRWYFDRLRRFGDIANQKGLVLFNGLYMQHSVLEAGAHYADAPWRSANNTNNVGIPEPVFFASDKLIYVAAQFYDVTNKDRADLHRTYMRNVLNELADKPNVILFLSEEYTGPLAFTQFWLDVVAEWKKETGKEVKIALYATKDVTDAIMADEKRSAVVTILYNRFNNEGDAGWWYQPDGSLYAPEGGKNLSPRQWARLLKPKPAAFEQVLKAVHEYRSKYPDKPFVYEGPAELAWAVLLGGGSIPALPKTTDASLLVAIAKMRPMQDRIGLRDDSGNELVYIDQKPADAVGIDMKTGQLTTTETKLFWIKPASK